LSDLLDVSYNTARQIITNLLEAQILTDENKQKRGKLYRFAAYLDLLEKEYDI